MKSLLHIIISINRFSDFDFLCIPCHNIQRIFVRLIITWSWKKGLKQPVSKVLSIFSPTPNNTQNETGILCSLQKQTSGKSNDD